jgi:hypothetical protein
MQPDILRFVKSLRIWLLVFLAVLLPVRGVMAAAVLCPLSGGQPNLSAQVYSPPEKPPPLEAVAITAGHEAHHGLAAVAQPGDRETGSGHYDHGSAADKCSVCAAVCSLTPLLASFPPIAVPDLAGESFPALLAPVPSFLSSGQDRPPRSI